MSKEELEQRFRDAGFLVVPQKGKKNRLGSLSPVSGPGKGTGKGKGKEGRNAGWRRIELTVDSGAVDTVVPPKELPQGYYPTEATTGGFHYVGADGSEIPHLGF